MICVACNQSQRICVCERIEIVKSCTKESRKKYLNIINKLKNNQTQSKLSTFLDASMRRARRTRVISNVGYIVNNFGNAMSKRNHISNEIKSGKMRFRSRHRPKLKINSLSLTSSHKEKLGNN